MTKSNPFRRLLVPFASLVMAVTLVSCAATETHQSTSELLENEALVAKVKTEMAQSSMETLLDVEVESFRNVVQLSGLVETQEEKEEAEAAAMRVEGVKSVENGILVKSEL